MITMAGVESHICEQSHIQNRICVYMMLFDLDTLFHCRSTRPGLFLSASTNFLKGLSFSMRTPDVCSTIGLTPGV